MTDAYLGLSSNVGDRISNLNKAIEMLDEIEGAEVLEKSRIYETAPVGYQDQGMFLNMACKVRVSIEPHALLGAIQNIECALKRVRTIKNGPRTIDVDILLFGNSEIETPNLTVPHPKMFERAFVLVPLSDIYPSDEIMGISFKERIQSCADKNDIAEI